jgi:hypothetical protein
MRCLRGREKNIGSLRWERSFPGSRERPRLGPGQPPIIPPLCLQTQSSIIKPFFSMFSRASQLARHFSRPLPNYAHRSAAFQTANRIMTSSTADERNSRTIHTAACLIIGDEVLGGKVCISKLHDHELDNNCETMADWGIRLVM